MCYTFKILTTNTTGQEMEIHVPFHQYHPRCLDVLGVMQFCIPQALGQQISPLFSFLHTVSEKHVEGKKSVNAQKSGSGFVTFTGHLKIITKC